MFFFFLFHFVALLPFRFRRREGLSEAVAGADEGGTALEWPASLSAALELIRSLQQEYPK